MLVVSLLVVATNIVLARAPSPASHHSHLALECSFCKGIPCMPRAPCGLCCSAPPRLPACRNRAGGRCGHRTWSLGHRLRVECSQAARGHRVHDKGRQRQAAQNLRGRRPTLLRCHPPLPRLLLARRRPGACACAVSSSVASPEPHASSAQPALTHVRTSRTVSQVVVTFSNGGHLFDYTIMDAVVALSAAYKAEGKRIEFRSLQQASVKMLQKASYWTRNVEYAMSAATGDHTASQLPSSHQVCMPPPLTQVHDGGADRAQGPRAARGGRRLLTCPELKAPHHRPCRALLVRRCRCEASTAAHPWNRPRSAASLLHALAPPFHSHQLVTLATLATYI